jgi:DUF4097 and DUF4098 domain-containing protein YvlB
MTTYTTPTPITATVEVAGARVRVTATDRTDTLVLVEPVDAGSKKDVKVAERTEVAFAGDRLTVKTTTSGRREGSVAITVELPTGSDLVAYLAHSDVEVSGALGECELHLASGRVRLDRVATLTANLSTGEVAAAHVAGDASIDGAAPVVRIDEAVGRVRVSSSGGDVRIGTAEAGLEVTTATAAVTVEQAAGDIAATTASGAIRIGRMSSGRATLSNASGDIEVGIGVASATSLDLVSERGTVHDLLSGRVQPGPSAPQVAVHARTRHGDVVVQPAAG